MGDFQTLCFKMVFGLKSSAFGKQFTRPVRPFLQAKRWMLLLCTMNLNRVCVSSETGFGAIIYLSSFITASTPTIFFMVNMNKSTDYSIHKPTFAFEKSTYATNCRNQLFFEIHIWQDTRAKRAFENHQMQSHFIWILAFFSQFGPIKPDLSGNTSWPPNWAFLAFLLKFCPLEM